MSREADLLAAIYADPGNDELRMVYADLLQERGEPQGELIALQLHSSPETRNRELELCRIHGKEFCGVPAGCVEELVFERGFLSRCALRVVPAQVDSAWATVEEIEIRHVSVATEHRLLAFFADARLRSLRAIRHMRGDLLARWGESGPMAPIERLSVDGFAAVYLPEPEHLPALRELGLGRYDLADSRVDDLSEARTARLISQLSRVSARFRTWRIDLEGADGRFWRLRAVLQLHEGASPRALDELLGLLEAVPQPLEQIEVDFLRQLDAGERARLDPGLAHHPDLCELIVSGEFLPTPKRRWVTHPRFGAGAVRSAHGTRPDRTLEIEFSDQVRKVRERFVTDRREPR